MRVPEESPSLFNLETVLEGLTLHDGTLCDHGHSIHPGGILLLNTMPVDTGTASRHLVLNIHNNCVTFTYLKVKLVDVSSFHTFYGQEFIVVLVKC